MTYGKGGKLGSAAVDSGSGTVNVTLDAGVAKDLYQALSLALGPGAGGKRKSQAAVVGKGGGKGYGGGRSKG
jgi:hypothetical protein